MRIGKQVVLYLLIFLPSSVFAIGPYFEQGTDEPVIYDQGTGLTWEKNIGDRDGNGSTSLNDIRTWRGALSYCNNLTLNNESDWRVPNIKELLSLVDWNRYNPALDPLFYDPPWDFYWSSTSSRNSISPSAYCVDFSEGKVKHFDKSEEWMFVRCVRDGVDGPKLHIDPTSNKEIVRAGEGIVFYINITNQGTSNLVDIPVKITHADNFGINGMSMWGCDPKESENPDCARTENNSPTGAEFSVNIAAGKTVKIVGTGIIEAAPVAVTVTAPGAVKTVIRGSAPPADLEGTQDVMLCSPKGCCDNDNCTPDILGIDSSKDTIVLTHGLQPDNDDDCNHENLWTGFKPDPAQAGYLLNEKYNGNVNVLQFFWRGACHNSGLTKESYEGARKNVYHAGEQLAYLLLQNLSVMYSKKIHFIGHSLGTAVTAYAANLFLRQASYVTKAQVTILDYPSTERVDKLLWFGDDWKRGELWGKEQGFDRNFFASTLPFDLQRDNYQLKVDNYFAAKPPLDTSLNAGVGTMINGEFYNHNEVLWPNVTDELFLEKEGIANDHSGMHQWYRWTVRPNVDKNFDGESVCSNDTWNNKPHVEFANQFTSFDGIINRCAIGLHCFDLGDKIPSLNPCNAGWHYSIIDGSVFPAPNGDKADATSSFNIEPSNVSSYGCAAGGIAGSYICSEDSAASSSLKTAALAATSESSEAPERFYAELDVNVPEFVRYISFDYTFTNTGDGDYVYLFAEGKSIWLMSGNPAQQGQKISSGPIPLRMTAGPNKLVIALYGVGEKNAEFQIENLKFTTVADTDSDGYGDDDDAFPDNPSEWTDTDEDGIGNNADLDDDNDGFADTDDTFPLDPNENLDTDEDGIGDNADLDDNMYPDLAVISQSLDKGGVAPGEDFTYSARVQNKGTGRARTSTIRYYLSSDSTIDSNDTLLGNKSVPVLNSGETSWDYINLNAPAELGKYWVGSCVDAISGDSDTTNNCRSSFPITVATNLPDLIISKLSSPSSVEAGKTFNVTQEVKNQGNLDATPTTANLYYMDIAAQTTSGVIHQEQVPALAVSQTVSQSPNIKAPCTAGDYLLSACVNSGENIEFGGNNNCTMNFFTVTGVCSEEPEKSFLPAIKLLLQ